MKKLRKQLLAILLVAVLILQIIPASVFAEEDQEAPTADNEVVVESTEDTYQESIENKRVLFEETSLREEAVKHFRLDDGSYIAVAYGAPVHYKDEDGKWVDYDNTLTPVTENDSSTISSYRVENGDSIRTFSATAGAEQLLSLQKGSYSLNFTPVHMVDEELDESVDQQSVSNIAEDGLSAVSVIDVASAGKTSENPLLAQTQSDKFYSALEYSNALNGADLRYENYGGTIKESIIISAPQSEYTYSFRIRTDGLEARLEDDSCVYFQDKDGATVYYIPAPYMIDAENNYSYEATYSLTGGDGNYTITVTADSSWLNEEDRVFPVTLDPTIVEPHITYGIFSGTYVRSGYPNAISDSTGIYVGNYDTNNKKTRGYFHADSIPWLPVGSEVFYAEFSLYQFAYQRKTNGATSLEVGLYPIIECTNPAMSSSEWHTYISNLTWNTVEGSSATYTHDATAMIDKVTASASTNNTYLTWNLTALARKWYGEYNMNLGFALIPENEDNATSRVSFYGPDHPTSYLPQFMVAYRSGVGLESYYSYQTIGIGRAGTSYICDYTLQNTLVVPLMSSGSNTMPFSLSLVYNSVYCENQFDDDNNICTKDFSAWQTGAGWKLSIQQTVIQKTIGSTTYLVYNDADGTEHYFFYSSYYGGYVDLDGLGLKITGSSASYTMENLYGYKKTFTNGYLAKEQDAYGNKLTYTYGSGIITVKRQNVGAAEETIAQIGYSGSRLNTVVSDCNFLNATDKAEHRTSFTYSTVNSIPLLTQITFPDGATANYEYYTDSTDQAWERYRLKKAYDAERGYGLEYSYSYGNDVCNIYEYNANDDYGAMMHAYKRTPSRTVYRYYGDDRQAETSDDFLTFALQDSRGRPISAYTTDWTEANVLAASAGAWTNNSNSNNSIRQNNRLTTSLSSGLQSVNLLFNGTMENSDYSTNSIGTWGRSSSNYIMPETTAFEEKASIGFERSAASTTIDKLYQNVSLKCGETYTLSAYVNVSNDVVFTNAGGIAISICSTNGLTTYASSESLNYSTTNAGNGWMRLNVTYTVPGVSGTVSRRVYITATGYNGTIYVDAVQLEAASAASTFNLVENGSFEAGTTLPTSAITGWYRQGNGSISDSGSPLFGSKALSLSGAGNRRALQHLKCAFPTDTTFLVSGWGSAHADPNGATEKTNSSDTYYGLILHLYYSDGEDDVFYYPFDVYDADWQYTEGVAAAKSAGEGATITDIYIAAAYDYNFGTAYFDNISLRIEPAQTYTYDSNGNLITTVQAGTGESVADYDGVDLVSFTAANGSTIEYEYDDAHNITGATFAGVTEALVRNSMGNVTASTLSGGSITLQSTAAYSADGDHTTRIRNVNNQLVEYTYSTYDERLLSTATKVLDANNNEVVHSKDKYTYDNAGRTTKIELVDASAVSLASINYTYSGGNLTALARTSKYNNTNQIQTYSLAYNTWGQTKSITVSGASNSSIELVSYSYKGYGDEQQEQNEGAMLAQTTYGNGQYAKYSYDDFDRLSEITYNNNGRFIRYYYNSEGALSKLAYGDGSITKGSCVFEYDSLGRLIRSAEYDGSGNLIQRTEHNYDAYNRLSSQKWVLGSTNYSESYSYSDGDEGDGSLTQMTTGTGKTLNYSYDAVKRLQNVTVKDGGTTLFTTAYAYRAISDNRSSAQVEFRNVRDSAGELLEGKKYTYDDLGNITMISESTGSYNPLVAYEYDSQNQLTKEIIYHYSNSGVTTDTYEYAYDTAGNIRSESVTQNGTTTTTNYTYGNSIWVDLLTKVNNLPIAYEGQAYTYSNGAYTVSGTPISGNPILYYNNGNEPLGMSWTNGRQLASVNWLSDQQMAFYSYDADGIRTKKIIETPGENPVSEYVTQNGKVVRETRTDLYDDTNIVLDFIYDESGRPFALIYTNGTNAPVTYYYILNLQGDVVKLLDENGSDAAVYAYDAWGNILPNSISGEMADINPLRYRGYYYDTETGWYYLQSRYYDPVIHRFINADTFASTGQGFLGYNMFAYCGNNPSNRCDSRGCFWEWIIPLVIIPLLLTGCTSTDEEEWPATCPYPYKPSGTSRTDDNCYSYIFNYCGVCDPGESSGINIFDSKGKIMVYRLKDGIMADALTRGRHVEELLDESYISFIPDNAYLVVCKLTTDRKDYHFAVRIPNGDWVDKPGSHESRYNKIDGLQDEWEVNGIVYDGVTLYYVYYPGGKE